MLTLLLVACSGEPQITIDDTGGGGGKDSGQDSVDPIEDPTFTFVLSGSTTGRALAIQFVDDLTYWITTEDFGGAPITSASVSVHLDDPPESVRAAYDDYPDSSFAFAPVGVYEDDDADNSQDFGEIFVGTGPVLLWIGGDVVPDMFELAGAEQGWNAIDGASLLTGALATFDPLAVPLSIEEPQEDVTLAGTYSGNPDDVGVLAVPTANGGVVASYLHDEPLDADGFTVNLSGPPPADHFEDADGDGFGEAGEYLVSYTDAAPPDGYSPGDTPRYPACVDGRLVLFYWLDGFDDLGRAAVYGIYGLGPGWSVVSTDGSDSTQEVDPADYTALTMSSGCTF